MKKLKKGLTAIGLTSLEAEVYVKLLKLKEAKVSELSRETKVTRTQLYPLLENLVEKGVVEKSDDKVTVYRVVNPEKIISILNRWKKEQLVILKDFETELKRIRLSF